MANPNAPIWRPVRPIDQGEAERGSEIEVEFDGEIDAVGQWRPKHNCRLGDKGEVLVGCVEYRPKCL